MKKLFVTLGLVFLSTGVLFGQSGELSLNYGLRAITNLPSFNKELPFWLHQQEYGIVDQSSANAIYFGQMQKRLIESDDFSLSSGGELIARASSNSALYLNQAFIDGRFKGFRLKAGRFIDPLALKEDELSTGSFIMSRNATPIPRIAFQTDDFITIPGANGIVNYKAYFAHGWFENNRYTSDVKLHQKYFYLNIKYAFFDAIGGIVHNVQWGGSNEAFGQLPSDFRTFIDVIFALGSGNPDAPGGEQSNATGNSVAAYDFSLGLDFKGVDLRAYRLFYLEDKVSTRFRSPWDGIWGLSIKPENTPFIQSILVEHINTKRQDSFDFEPKGTASYYNNGIYRTGWSYNGRVIGNSLILTDGSAERPVYNNIIIAHHLGMKGKLGEQLSYVFKFTNSRNYGVWQDQVIRFLEARRPVRAELRPLEEVKKLNQSLFLELEYQLPKRPELMLIGSVAADFGELYGNRLGLGLGLNYSLY